MRNLLVEVRSIRRCEGGHTCNLVANGKKVAFIAPGIFEWTNHSQMIDVLDWSATVFNSKPKEIKPVELKEGWENFTPDYKNNTQQEEAQAKLQKWIRIHIQAYEITQRCKSTVICISSCGSLMDLEISPKLLSSQDIQSIIKREGLTVFNDMDIRSIVSIILKERKILTA